MAPRGERAVFLRFTSQMAGRLGRRLQAWMPMRETVVAGSVR